MRILAVALTLALLGTLPAAAADPADTATDAAGAPAAAPAEQQQPPFGLKWGMQIADLGALGIKIDSTTQNGSLSIVNVKEMPGAFPDTGTVNMLFDRRLGLVKVRWTSTGISDDPTGTKGRARYGEMKKVVTQIRGNPSDETMVVGARLFDQEDEFYQCLSYEGCGVWSSLWEQKPSGGVLLSIEGTGPGKGYVQIDYESPDWQKVVAAPAAAAR
jgi:hypothetical protein